MGQSHQNPHDGQLLQQQPKSLNHCEDVGVVLASALAAATFSSSSSTSSPLLLRRVLPPWAELVNEMLPVVLEPPMDEQQTVLEGGDSLAVSGYLPRRFRPPLNPITHDLEQLLCYVRIFGAAVHDLILSGRPRLLGTVADETMLHSALQRMGNLRKLHLTVTEANLLQIVPTLRTFSQHLRWVSIRFTHSAGAPFLGASTDKANVDAFLANWIPRTRSLHEFSIRPFRQIASTVDACVGSLRHVVLEAANGEQLENASARFGSLLRSLTIINAKDVAANKKASVVKCFSRFDRLERLEVIKIIILVIDYYQQRCSCDRCCKTVYLCGTCR